MPRNLVICCDGTNNQFGKNNTNVVRLVQMLVQDSSRQRLYYDPGVGTLPEPGFVTALGKWLSKVAGLALGVGLTRNVEEAYAYLMEQWEPGDRVFLFGFSRGAYTVRVLAGLLHALGLLPAGATNQVSYLMRIFKSVRGADRNGGEDKKRQYWDLCDEFRATFARPVDGGDDRRFPIHFLGVWDTVSSVGWVWDPASYPFTARNPGIAVIRHAIALDERRAFYRQNRMYRAGEQDLEQRWFPGVHSDVGGGYVRSESGLWLRPLEWIVDEAERAGLLVDAGRRERIRNGVPAESFAPHKSLKGWWWLAEAYPKQHWDSKRGHDVYRPGWGHPRRVKAGELIDRSALSGPHAPGYYPRSLSKRFVDGVRSGDDTREAVPYEP